MKYTTRFGKVIDIPISDYLNMSDEQLELLEEKEGTAIYFGDEFNTHNPEDNEKDELPPIQE